MSFQYKIHKYQQKSKELLKKIQCGGNGDDIYEKLRSDLPMSSLDMSKLLIPLVKPLKWFHAPSEKEVDYDIFSLSSNPFNVTSYWHTDLTPHNGPRKDGKEITINCGGCLRTSKLDQRFSLENPILEHHVDQHLFRVSREYLYTYNLRTCSVIALMQDDYVGMMHIDAASDPKDILEYIDTFEKNVGKFNERLKIFGFFNEDIFRDGLDYRNQFSGIYELIIKQYHKYGKMVFENIHMNLPHLDGQYNVSFDARLYIFCIPRLGIRCFYSNAKTSNVSRYVTYEDTKLYVKVYEQQLDRCDKIVAKLKHVFRYNLMNEITHTLNNSRQDVPEDDIYGYLEYLLSYVNEENEPIVCVKLSEFLEDRGINSNYFLLAN
jgi:hypothetical protein